ncbi:peptidoglycan-binding protein LysM [Flavobacterium hercynium]|uniref:LysM domain-containing protein n=1 Tax=Flavobacterium hercynium TaxID=387094 RepID=A0A226H0B7_9FLAO|nr:peptidoglycan-binding protein LysM [Flavobacterium hercynium]OXA87625.1 hypothetical protein B0A66_15940 [Flavobacterium hercynium]SMP11156.1 hypothetical protein SAMN06265346_10388 [Flavobacterium hercynium]
MKFFPEIDEHYYDKFRTYQLTKGDTLVGVSQKLNIDASEIRRYHNRYCDERDLIEKDFKGHTKFLILAPEKTEANLAKPTSPKSQNVNFGSATSLPFFPKDIQKDYSVKYTFKTQDLTEKLEMGIRVKWLNTDVNNYHLIEIRKSVNLFVNNNMPDTIMDEIGAKMVQVLYPLQIIVDPSGKCIDVFNDKEIRNRWESKKIELLQDYENGIIPIYMKNCQLALESAESLFQLLKSDYFLRSFFNGIHTSYTEEGIFEHKVYFPVLNNKESQFLVKQKIDSCLNEARLIKVEQKGNCINTNAQNQLIDGSYISTYFLDPHSYFIEKMELECRLELEKTFELRIEIEAIKN